MFYHSLIYSCLLACSIIFLIMTCITDPGIIPRRHKDQIAGLEHLPESYRKAIEKSEQVPETVQYVTTHDLKLSADQFLNLKYTSIKVYPA